jgi:CDP-diacylglycerol--serine O-phosphatidyltransferase
MKQRTPAEGKRRRRRRPRRQTVTRRARRGIYILPSVLTVCNVFAGFASIVAADQGEFMRAAVLLMLAAVLDNLDGRVARMTGTTSDFGVQFDSLADLISFGLAPAFLVYQWGMMSLGRVGWVAAFLFLICGAMRLARFNIQRGSDKNFFIGLPIPAAALVIATLVFYRPEPVSDTALAAAVLLLVLTLSGLMVSRLRYRSFKALDARGPWRSFLIVGLLALLLAAVAVEPQVSLLALALVYMLSGLMPRLSRERRLSWKARWLGQSPSAAGAGGAPGRGGGSDEPGR